MTARYPILFMFLFAACLPATALADAEAGEAYATIMMNYIDDDPERGVDDGIAGGQAGLGWAFAEHWNVEAWVALATLSGPNKQDQASLGADLQLVFARDSRITPYLFAGAGYLQVRPPGADNDDGGMYSAGVGVLADIFGDSRTALRAEYRYRRDSIYSDDLDDQIISLGLHIPFGKREVLPAAAPVDPDSDGDGVPDSRDRCPDTPAGVRVDADGCPLDSDGDGVADDRDNCPNTVRGAPVDERGCELDSDGDGVVDRLDQCPDTRAGAPVDRVGCELQEEIRLTGVNFETNSDRLLPGAESTLDLAVAAMQRYPALKVEVAGHTDSMGDAAYNESLSARRAATVRDYLIRAGIDESRVTARGYGETQPIADNSTSEGRAENRRVMLRILER